MARPLRIEKAGGMGDLGRLLFEWSRTDSDIPAAAARRQEAEQWLNDYAAGMRRRYADQPFDEESYRGKLREFVRGIHWARGPAAARGFLEEAVQRAPDNHLTWYLLSIYQLSAGDREGYQQTCREMLRRYADTADPNLAEITVKTCHLQDQEFDPEDQQRLEKLTGVFGSSEDRWFFVAAGLHHFRRGRHADSLERLRSVLNHEQHNIRALARSVAALVEIRLGKRDAAQQHLLEAEKAFGMVWPDPLSESPPFLNEDIMRALILYREARALLEQSAEASSALAPLSNPAVE